MRNAAVPQHMGAYLTRPRVCPQVFPNVKPPPEQTAAQFSPCAMKGLAVKPRKGNAVAFWSLKARPSTSLSRTSPVRDVARAVRVIHAGPAGAPITSLRPGIADCAMLAALQTDGRLDKGALHGGCPVIKGEKWCATLCA